MPKKSRIGKMQYIHTVECNTTVKSNELTHTMKTTLTDIILNNRSQTQKKRHRIIYICLFMRLHGIDHLYIMTKSRIVVSLGVCTN